MRNQERPARPRSSNGKQLFVESLEDRCVPTTLGSPWPNASDLTVSFAPDGTQDGASTSALFQQFNPLNVSGNDWQLQVLKALQTWAVNANINVSVTSDGGQAFGTPGA